MIYIENGKIKVGKYKGELFVLKPSPTKESKKQVSERRSNSEIKEERVDKSAGGVMDEEDGGAIIKSRESGKMNEEKPDS